MDNPEFAGSLRKFSPSSFVELLQRAPVWPRNAPLSDSWETYRQLLPQLVGKRPSVPADRLQEIIAGAPNEEAEHTIRVWLIERLIRENIAKAEVEYTKLPPDHPALYHLCYLFADRYRLRRRLDRAGPWYRKIPKESYRYPEATLRLAQIDLAKAPRDARDALLRLPPDGLTTRQRARRLNLLGQALLKTRQKKAATIVLSESWRRYPRTAKKNRRLFKKVGVPGTFEVIWKILKTQRGRKRTRTLNKRVRRYKKSREKTATIAYAFGRIYRFSRERERAMKRFDRALHLSRDLRLRVQVDVEAALTAYQLGDNPRIIISVERATRGLRRECSKNCPPALLILDRAVWPVYLKALLGVGRTQDALDIFAQLEPWTHGSSVQADMLELLAKTAYVDGALDIAEDYFQRLLERYPDLHNGARVPRGIRSLRWLAHIAQMSQRPDAVTLYETALQERWPLHAGIDPSHIHGDESSSDWRQLPRPKLPNTPWTREARFLLYAGRTRPAMEAMQIVFRRGRANPHTVATLVHTALALGRPGLGKRVLHQYGGMLGAHGTLPGALLPLVFSIRYLDEIRQAAHMVGVPADLLAAIVYHESGFNPKARSTAGAIGLAQVMPNTAKIIAKRHLPELKINRRSLRDPQTNLVVGAYVLADYLKLYDGDELKALIAYNAGPSRFRKSFHHVRKIPEDVQIDVLSLGPSVAYARRVQVARNIYRLLFGSVLTSAPHGPSESL